MMLKWLKPLKNESGANANNPKSDDATDLDTVLHENPKSDDDRTSELRKRTRKIYEVAICFDEC